MNQDVGANCFKFTVIGTVSWASSWLASLDVGQMVGLLVAVCGIVLQAANFLRGRREEKLNLQKHSAEMVLLEAQIAEARLRRKRLQQSKDDSCEVQT